MPWCAVAPGGDDDDWWVIERFSGRGLSWASIEGSGAEMRGIAEAILDGDRYAAKRAAIHPSEDGATWSIWSPRNHASSTLPTITAAEATVLARQIMRDVPEVADEPMPAA